MLLFPCRTRSWVKICSYSGSNLQLQAFFEFSLSFLTYEEQALELVHIMGSLEAEAVLLPLQG